MSTSPPPTKPLTLRERFQMVKDLLPLPFVVLAGLFKSENKGRSVGRVAYDSAMRYMAYRPWNIRQMLAFFGAQNSTQVYDAWVKSNKLENLTDEVEDGGKLHWVGPRNYDRVLIYSHGGGYCFPANPNQHLGFLKAVKAELEKTGKPTGIIFLAYSLTPFSSFPTQLRQINAAVTHVLSKGTSPSNIILTGDSAGGNLTLQFLSHTLHPLPEITPPPTLSSPLAGVLLISPWVAFGQEYSSFKENGKKDNINHSSLKFMADLATPGIPTGQEEWFEPIKSDEAWWHGLDGKVKRVMSTAGEVECLKDPIEEFSMTRLKPNIKDFSWLVEKNGVHIDFLCDFQVKQGGKGEAYGKVISWLNDTLQG